MPIPWMKGPMDSPPPQLQHSTVKSTMEEEETGKKALVAQSTSRLHFHYSTRMHDLTAHKDISH